MGGAQFAVLSAFLPTAKGPHTLLLYSLLAIQLSYIVVDFLIYHSNYCTVCGLHCWLHSGPGRLEDVNDVPSICRKEGYFGDAPEESRTASSVAAPDPWQQMKWIGQPATCGVRGMLIEKLDEENNFRRGYALKFVGDVEDKTHLLPWLLGARVDLNRRSKRRVYIDLGAHRWRTSVRWFLRMYPCDFTEVHAFEANPWMWRQPIGATSEEEESNLFSPDSVNGSVRVRRTPALPQWMLDRIHIHFNVVADEDNVELNKVNITRFLKEELKLTKWDAVVVKMDIEGSEWPILQRWLRDPEMPLIVDELFVELHYAHPTMAAYGWDSFRNLSTREHAKRVLSELRWRGFYAHAWP